MICFARQIARRWDRIRSRLNRPGQIPYATSFDYDQTGANSLYNALASAPGAPVHAWVLVAGVLHVLEIARQCEFDRRSSPIVVQQDGNYAAERGLRRSTCGIRCALDRLCMSCRSARGTALRAHGWESNVFGDWRLQNIVTWHTGTPFTAYLGGGASNNSGTGANFSERAEQVGDPNTAYLWRNGARLSSIPARSGPGRGNVWRRTARGDRRAVQLQLERFAREIISGSDHASAAPVDVRWEVQNLTNTPSFTGISTVLGIDDFWADNFGGIDADDGCDSEV